MYYQFGYLDTLVSQVMSLCFFNHNDGMLLHIIIIIIIITIIIIIIHEFFSRKS